MSCLQLRKQGPKTDDSRNLNTTIGNVMDDLNISQSSVYEKFVIDGDVDTGLPDWWEAFLF